MKLELVTYGCGKSFDIKKFQPVKNRMHIKPKGGLWASPINSEFGWKDWCKIESFGDLSYSFEFLFEGNVFVVDSLKDIESIPWIELNYYPVIKSPFTKFPDFEKILLLGYDAVLLTRKGEQETRFSEPVCLYGWDCESVLIMNPSGISKPE